MKNNNFSSVFKIFFSLSLIGVLLAFAMSCSKDDDEGGAGSSHKVIFKAQAAAGGKIEIATFGYDSAITSVSSINATSWTSPEVTVPAGSSMANVTATGVGTDGSSSLKVQVYVDGVLKKEGTSTGQALVATASYTF